MSAAATQQIVETLGIETDPNVWSEAFRTMGSDFLTFSASAYNCFILITGPIGRLTVLG